MSKLRRGEIWRFRFSGAVGNEIGAKDVGSQSVRWGVVVSHDDFNQPRDHVTVIPVKSDGQGLQSNWNVMIKKADYPRLRYDSFINCEELCTLRVYRWRNHPRNDFFGGYRGKLREHEFQRVEDNLQKVFTGQRLPSGGMPPFQKGQVLTVNFVNRSRWYLVVSHPRFEALRQKNDRGLCIVVPLIPFSPDAAVVRGTAPVTLIGDDQIVSQRLLALCKEIYTIDWEDQDRKGKKIGCVVAADMTKVYDALGDYLDITFVQDAEASEV